MRIWFTAMAGPGSIEDLKELLEPIRVYVDGLVITYHGEREDEEAVYLESVKHEGKIIYLPYSRRHSYSRNAYLYCGPIEQGDWIISCDVLERINETFAANLAAFIREAEAASINTIYYYGKVFLYQFHESHEFVGTPHEGLRRHDGQTRAIELNQRYAVEKDIRWNVRPERRRDPHHFVKHYARYALFPWGANHYMLGLEGKPNAAALYHQRDNRRLDFIEHLRDLGISRDVDSVIEHMKDMPESTKVFVQSDKILNDLYRRYVLGLTDFKDDHDWSNMIPIP